MSKTTLVRFLFQLHRWTGVLAALPIFIILVTGVPAVYKDEIDRMVYPALLQVTPGSSRIPLDQARQTLERQGFRISSLALPDRPDSSLMSYVRDAQGRNLQAFVDPYRGDFLGSRPANGHIADIIRQTHVRFFYFGANGRIVVGAFGIVLFLLGASGLLLYPRFMRRQKWTEIRWRRGPQWLHADLHKLIGISTLALNLLWAVSGAVLGLENLATYHKPTQRLLHPVPTVKVNAPLQASLDALVATASGRVPNFQPNIIQMPSAKGGPVVITGNVRGTWTAPSSSFVALHPQTGVVLEVHDERRAHAITQTYNLMDPFHFGTFMGEPSRVVYFVAGILVSLLPITGIALWLYKRRHQKPRQTQPSLPVGAGDLATSNVLTGAESRVP